MRNLKKIISLALALMMVLSVMVTASAADFTDADSVNYEEAVQVMAGLGVINGVENADGTFSFLPTEGLKRDAAAKIVAYIKLGGPVDTGLAAALPNNFTDVAGWAESVIKYCNYEGIIDGMGDGTFLPAEKLTGYAFAKMLLVAAGIPGEYTGNSWKVNIYTNAKNAGLLKGLETVDLGKGITREQACQMAFNAMQYSSVAATSVYVVKDNGVTLYKGSDALTALIFKNSSATATLALETISTGSLMDTVFGAMESSSTDAFGRVSKTWVSYDGKTVYAELKPTAVLTYTAATTHGKIAADLGCTKAATVTLNVHNNSAASTAYTPNKDDKTAIGGQGTLVEVIKTGKDVYDVIVVDTKAYQLTADDIKKAVKDQYGDVTVPAHVVIDGMTYDTTAFKKGDVVLYTVADGEIANVVKASGTSGSVTATNAAAKYFRLDGEKKSLAAHNGATIGAGLYAVSEDVNTYYADAYGNIIYAVAGQKAEAPKPENIYLISTAAKGATYVAGDLYGAGSGTDAKAQAQVMDLTTGAISIVDLAIVKHTDGKWYYADATGAPTANEVTTHAVTPVEAIYEYNKLENGTVVLGNAAETKNVTVAKNSATVSGGYYANAKTVINVLTYTKNYASVEKTSYTGIANFPKTATYANALVVANDANMIETITVVKAYVEDVQEDMVFGVYTGAGETSAAGTAHSFVVGGETVNYYPAKNETVSYDEGALYMLVLTDGKLTAAGSTKLAPVELEAGVVSYVEEDNSFIIVDGTPYYLAKDCEILDEAEGYAYGTVAAEDVVTLYVDEDGKVVCIIVAE